MNLNKVISVIVIIIGAIIFALGVDIVSRIKDSQTKCQETIHGMSKE